MDATPPSFFVTGASSGVGLEATRQLAVRLSRRDQDPGGTTTTTVTTTTTTTTTATTATATTATATATTGTVPVTAKIYLLCRSEEKARAAIQSIASSLDPKSNDNSNSNDNSKSNSNGNGSIQLEFLKFDALDDDETIRRNIRLPTATKIRGILLNAGGFGEATPSGSPNNNVYQTKSNQKNQPRRSSTVARLNLIGHVVLVRHLLSVGTTDASTRIVAAGSEASFVTPGLTLAGYRNADFAQHLSASHNTNNNNSNNNSNSNSNKSNTNRMGVGTEYAWAKGILALYWAAFARHHPNLVVRTVSPGAIPNTGLLNNLPGPLRTMALVSQWSCFGGSHTATEGAERYMGALFDGDGDGDGDGESSGSFWASRKGFARDFGNVATLSKGRFVAEMELQDEAWEAVHAFLE